MPVKELILIGGGGHALVVAEAAGLAGHGIAGFFDDNPRAVVAQKLGLRHMGSLDDFYRRPPGEAWFVVALGDLRLRGAFLADLGARPDAHATTVIHPDATVSATARIGPGGYVGPRAIVHSFASVRAHAIVNSGAIVEHECEVGENVHVAPGAVLGGNVNVGRGSLVGIGARVLPGITIGAGSVVGAGAVVVQDVADGVTVVGVPAERLI